MTTTPQAIPATQPPLPGTEGNPRALSFFLGYRLLAALFLALTFFALERGSLGALLPGLFTLGLGFYLVLAILALLANLRSTLPVAIQSGAAALLDLVCLGLLMYASGGVQSGLGILIAISVALGAVNLGRSTALLLAAVASLVVLSGQFIGQSLGMFADASHLQAGLLGLAYFALALLAQQLAARALLGERLARQRGADLANLEKLNDYVIQQLQAGILVIDRQQTVQLVNGACWALLGMPDANTSDPLERFSARLAQEYQAWRDNPDYPGEPFRVAQAGRDIRADFTPLGEGRTLIVLEDTAMLTAQAQQMKLASLGRLTTGIAHEIRNPLGAISHAAQLLNESPTLESTDRRMGEIIQQNSLRVNEVIENIFKLSHHDAPRRKSVVLGPWLGQRAADIRLAHLLDDEQLSVRVEPQATTVSADPEQLCQVVEALCDNAVRHFEGNRAELRIRLLAGILGETDKPFLEVRDNGPGIAPEDASKLYEPFFSTREGGAGLGLYIARQLSEANRVRLEYRPLQGGGSSFRLSFPRPNNRTT